MPARDPHDHRLRQRTSRERALRRAGNGDDRRRRGHDGNRGVSRNRTNGCGDDRATRRASGQRTRRVDRRYRRIVDVPTRHDARDRVAARVARDRVQRQPPILGHAHCAVERAGFHRDRRHALRNHHARMRHESADDDGDARRPGTACHHGSIAEHDGHARIIGGPDGMRADEHASALVGDRRREVQRVADRECGVGGWPNADPRRADVADGLVRVGTSDHAVRVQRRHERHHRGTGRCDGGNGAPRVREPGSAGGESL